MCGYVDIYTYICKGKKNRLNSILVMEILLDLSIFSLPKESRAHIQPKPNYFPCRFAFETESC
jgi:hypothetical protein